MLYYNKIIISLEQKKIMGYLYLKLNEKINKHSILLPDNDGMDCISCKVLY